MRKSTKAITAQDAVKLALKHEEDLRNQRQRQSFAEVYEAIEKAAKAGEWSVRLTPTAVPPSHHDEQLRVLNVISKRLQEDGFDTQIDVIRGPADERGRMKPEGYWISASWFQAQFVG